MFSVILMIVLPYVMLKQQKITVERYNYVILVFMCDLAAV